LRMSLKPKRCVPGRKQIVETATSPKNEAGPEIGKLKEFEYVSDRPHRRYAPVNKIRSRAFADRGIPGCRNYHGRAVLIRRSQTQYLHG
jgi:hypothetical protein